MENLADITFLQALPTDFVHKGMIRQIVFFPQKIFWNYPLQNEVWFHDRGMLLVIQYHICGSWIRPNSV